MNSLSINANFIVEGDATFYPVRLQVLPRVGEIIQFQSHRNMAARQQPYFSRFEVLRVEHEVQDFVEDKEKLSGSHDVHIIVKDIGLL